MTQTVLWVDDDHRDMQSVAWAVARAGAVLVPAASVEEGLEFLQNSRPEALLLDLILPSREGQRYEAPLPGLHLWEQLDGSLREKTIVLSVMPYEKVAKQYGIPQARYFLKTNLGAQHRAFIDALSRILFEEHAHHAT
jgi:ActR/RegA family two-component response regulator